MTWATAPVPSTWKSMGGSPETWAEIVVTPGFEPSVTWVFASPVESVHGLAAESDAEPAVTVKWTSTFCMVWPVLSRTITTSGSGSAEPADADCPSPETTLTAAAVKSVAFALLVCDWEPIGGPHPARSKATNRVWTGLTEAPFRSGTGERTIRARAAEPDSRGVGRRASHVLCQPGDEASTNQCRDTPGPS